MLGLCSLSLVDSDHYSVLIVRRSREAVAQRVQLVRRYTKTVIKSIRLALLCRNHGVSVDDWGENSTSGFDTKCQRVDVQDGDFLLVHVSANDSRLNSSTIGYGLVRIDTS